MLGALGYNDLDDVRSRQLGQAHPDILRRLPLRGMDATPHRIEAGSRSAQTGTVPVHPKASAAIQRYLGEVDSALPAFIVGVYATGSVALGDFHPDISDVDLVCVCATSLDDTHLQALATVHRPSHPHVDVLYISEDDLRSDPRTLSSPHSHEGGFRAGGAFTANPVTWRDLQTTALTVRGRPLGRVDVWFDADALRDWNYNNLTQYWQGQLSNWQTVQPTEALVRHEYGLQWLVLGVPRLHYTIATLGLTSKTGAGRYALQVVDSQWHPVIESAMALRADREAALSISIEEARRQGVELCAWLIDDARRLAQR